MYFVVSNDGKVLNKYNEVVLKQLKGNKMSNQNQVTPVTPVTHLNFSAPAQISVPSISSAAMLVELSISTWTGKKTDRKVSNEVTLNKNAASGVVNVSKKLLGDCAELDAVQKFVGNVRNRHYAMTQPWSDTGLRLLSTAMFHKKYQAEITAHQDEFQNLVDKFLDAYDWEITQAEAKLGDMFNRGEYPSKEALRHKFKFQLIQMPLPEAGDFRLDINNEAQELLKTQYAEHYETMLNNAMKDIWDRAYDALSKMSERLDYKDEGAKKVFRDSLVENVMDVVELLNLCNVTGNAQMQAMKERLENALLGVTPDALREDAHLRGETKREVDEILKNMSW